MDLWDLKIGDRVRTIDGSIAEILKETLDGKWILVRYLEGATDPALMGTEDLCAEDELEELIAQKTNSAGS